MIGAELHSHHAIQVIVTCRPVTLSSPSGASITTDRAVVPADVEHRIDASGQHGTLTYWEPPQSRGAQPSDPAAWALAGAALPDVGTGIAAVRVLRDHLSVRPPQNATDIDPDLQVLEAQAAIRNLLPARVRLAEIAGLVAISPSRLTHRFSIATGIPFGRWVLWERLQLAGTAVAHGADLTEAAHRSGFADSAHLNRTFRKMFGIAPSDIAGTVAWASAPIADSFKRPSPRCRMVST